MNEYRDFQYSEYDHNLRASIVKIYNISHAILVLFDEPG